MRPPCPTPRYPPGVFPGGPLSGLPVSPSGPLVTLGWVTPEPRVTFAGVSPGALRHAPLPAPRPPGACLPRPGARPPLCPRPPVILPSNGVQAPAPPPAPAPTRHAPCAPVPSSRSRMAGRAQRPPTPPPPERQPPSTARSPRSPRTPTPPRPPAVAPRCAGGLGGPRGGRPRPLHFFQECAPHAPPPDTPRGSFLGGLCQGCLCHPAAPWSRLAGSPRSPGSRLPGSALGPFVTLRCPRPAPRGLACRGRGRDRLSVPAPLSFSPPTACRLPRRPPLPPPPDTPPAPLSPPRGHAWLGGRSAPRPPHPLNASRHPPPAAPGARGPRPPPARRPLRRAVRGG